MTREEAIKMLKSKMDGSVDTSYEWVETVRLAIEALERALCIREKCAYCPHCEHCDVDDETLAIKALEPSEDAISREAVDEYITNLLSGYLYEEERTRLEDLTAFVWELPSVQPYRAEGEKGDI